MLLVQLMPSHISSCRLSLQYHPDKNKTKGAQEKFAEINDGIMASSFSLSEISLPHYFFLVYMCVPDSRSFMLILFLEI